MRPGRELFHVGQKVGELAIVSIPRVEQPIRHRVSLPRKEATISPMHFGGPSQLERISISNAPPKAACLTLLLDTVLPGLSSLDIQKRYLSRDRLAVDLVRSGVYLDLGR